MRRYVILRHNEDPVRSSEKGYGLAGPPRLQTEAMTRRQAADVARDPLTRAVAPVMPLRLIRPTQIGPSSDPQKENWGLRAIGADLCPFDGRDTVMAVLDSGIDATHPAFSGVKLIKKNFVGDDDDEGDDNGHGTHCAGVIFGRDDAQGRRIGVARGVSKALIGKVLDKDLAGRSDALFEAMLWAMSKRADVISLSVAFDFPGAASQLEQEEGWPKDLAVSAALESYRRNLRMCDAVMGVLRAQKDFGDSPLVIAATGNESRRDVDREYRIAAGLPAAGADVIAVGALRRAGEGRYAPADFSNSQPRFCAPGVDILSAAPGGGLAVMSGTSMACPHVAGLAALWRQALSQGGRRRVDAHRLAASLSDSVRRDVFTEDADEDDVGEGLPTAPPPQTNR